MTDKNYITPSQYEKIVRKMKEYVDKSIPHIKTQELFTLSADKVLEIYNSDSKMMEFVKPSNINSDGNFIVNYNNKDINTNIMNDAGVKYILCKDNNINIEFVLGVNVNDIIDENKMVVLIQMLNTGITPTDVILKQQDIKLLNNKYLKDDVAIRNSITIGSRNIANNIGKYSFSNGKWSTASGDYSHAEGFNTKASSDSSHAEGHTTTASGYISHAEGYYTKASSQHQHVQGKYNIEDTSDTYAHIVGNGTDTARSNAHTLDWSGNGWYAGKLSQEGTPTEDKDLTTKKYVDANNITDAEIDAVFNELSMRPIKRYKINYDYDKSACVVYPTPSYMYENDEVSITVAYSEGYSLQAIIVMQGKNNITNNVVNSDRNLITLKSINDDINVKIVLKENGPS